MTPISKVELKCDVVDGRVVNGIREPILFSFVSDKPAGCKLFSEPQTIHHIKKSVLNTIKFYLEDDNHQKVKCNQETLTSTLQLIKI